MLLSVKRRKCLLLYPALAIINLRSPLSSSSAFLSSAVFQSTCETWHSSSANLLTWSADSKSRSVQCQGWDSHVPRVASSSLFSQKCPSTPHLFPLPNQCWGCRQMFSTKAMRLLMSIMFRVPALRLGQHFHHSGGKSGGRGK